MKVYIGPYKEYWGVYQLTDLLLKVNVSEERCDKIAKWFIDRSGAYNFWEWIDNKRIRNIQVRIDEYDTWSMDSTLAYIILPMLKQLKETKHGAPNIDDKDVPKKLRSTSVSVKENEGDTDNNWFDRWEWVLDEMIWTFSQVNEDWQDQFYKEDGKWHFEDRENDMSEMVWDKKPAIDKKGLKTHYKRMQNGLGLFGKYFLNLWD